MSHLTINFAISFNSYDSLVTVIIPCFNAENYLSDTINSLLNQTYNNYEILIFDDGSTDYSLDICNKYAFNCDIITVFHRKNNREVGFIIGFACTLNDLISFSTGEYILRSDSDDISHPSRIELLVNHAVKNKSDILSSPMIPFRKELYDLDMVMRPLV